MGATKSNTLDRKGPDSARQAPAYGGGNSTTNGSKLTWFSVNPEKVADAVGQVAANGDAISFAQARNGTWLSVTILAGAERPRWTAYSAAEMDAFLDAIAEAAIAQRG